MQIYYNTLIAKHCLYAETDQQNWELFVLLQTYAYVVQTLDREGQLRLIWGCHNINQVQSGSTTEEQYH